ncbi:hypothetical protein AWC38_SpisGene22562 [Stylophora pistillata]|uniref:Uncharacterized protein n=1 Tax=Stylophora pistillata TaxID=50429 RepID=A0A2B4RAH9_STYPI|nr:hypothetical protein AWC38_SpisGene22562 [Stylophora pistillata]
MDEQEAANLFENFTTNYQNMTLGEGQPGVEKLSTESIFKVAVAFEKIVLSYGKYHLRGTNRSKRISYPHRNMLLVIKKDYKQTASDFHSGNHEWQAYINISSGNFVDNGVECFRVDASLVKKLSIWLSLNYSTPSEEEEVAGVEWKEFKDEVELLNSIHAHIVLKHLVIYDTFNVCEYATEQKLLKLNNTILKEILDYYDITYASKDRKNDFVARIEELVTECGCLQ